MTTTDSDGLRDVRAFFRTSFARKVVSLCLVTTLATLLAALAVMNWRVWRSDVDDLTFDQTEVAEHLLSLLATPGAEPMGQAQAVVKANEHTRAAAYYAESGATFAFMKPDDPQPAPPRLGVTAPRVIQRLDGVEVHLPQVRDGRVVGELALFASNFEVRADMVRNTLTSLVILAVGSLAAGALAATLTHRALRPLHSLNRAIESVRLTRDFKSKAKVTSEDEIGRLAENFNALLADLEIYHTSLARALADVTAARDSAEEATRLKSQFLANMSHEIRTPLNGVLSMAQVMDGDELTPLQRERLDVVRKSGASLLAVLNDILDLAKVEAGKLELEAAPFDVEEVADGACAVFTSSAHAKGLSFGLTLSDAARGWWRGDSVRVRQLLYNLISNAIKFTEEGGVRVEIDADETGLRMAVSDTGIGVVEADLDRLFESFTQADSSTTRRFGGTGLGLTICRQIAEMMGGRITARSAVGVGTVFEVALPLARETAPAPAGETDVPEAVDFGGLRVLAAEDNETNQLVLKTILHALGVAPTIVGDGRRAVEAWRREAFDLVLMDIQMPGVDGVTATREIRALEAAEGRRRTRIVALSANAMRHQVSSYLDAGMDGHLAKPIAVEKLHDVLAAAALAATRAQAEAA